MVENLDGGQRYWETADWTHMSLEKQGREPSWGSGKPWGREEGSWQSCGLSSAPPSRRLGGRPAEMGRTLTVRAPMCVPCVRVQACACVQGMWHLIA